ncbi:MAG TPA: hypothetical protein VGP82_11825 [Ktedonobacterales bacterium]|nr:hypothetical protein [Ktedonobacterales bacterium]
MECRRPPPARPLTATPSGQLLLLAVVAILGSCALLAANAFSAAESAADCCRFSAAISACKSATRRSGASRSCPLQMRYTLARRPAQARHPEILPRPLPDARSPRLHRAQQALRRQSLVILLPAVPQPALTHGPLHQRYAVRRFERRPTTLPTVELFYLLTQPTPILR